MSKVVSLQKARDAKNRSAARAADHGGFVACSQDMTICGDCEGNRARNACPRLKEWIAKQARKP